MINWKLKKFKISELKPYAKNPRTLSQEQYKHLKTSLDKFGLIDKPICTKEGMLIGGHQRVKVLSKDKIDEVECWVADKDLSDKDIEELNIRLNQNVGSWDFEILANQFDPIELVEWGFDPSELEVDLKGMGGEEEEGQEILEPGKDEDAVTKSGDLIEINYHKIVCGDATDLLTVNLLGDFSKIILMVTDPPYGVNYDPSWRRRMPRCANAKINYIKPETDNEGVWKNAIEKFPGNIIYYWHASKFSSEIEIMLNEIGFECKYQIIWDKTSGFSRGDYNWCHEPCWYAVRNGEKHNWQGARDQQTIWRISLLSRKIAEGDENVDHACQKPLECMEIPIKNNTAEGDAVYDPFLGSGTTLIAADKLNRICYGIEISPAYCDIIVKRWINFRKKNGKDCTVKKNGKICEDYVGVA